jgi:hypothetical protein
MPSFLAGSSGKKGVASLQVSCRGALAAGVVEEGEPLEGQAGRGATGMTVRKRETRMVDSEQKVLERRA